MKIAFAKPELPETGSLAVAAMDGRKLGSHAAQVEKLTKGAVNRAIGASRFKGGAEDHLALLAPVKPGFVEGFESVTYARRLEAVLKTLNAIRLATRESSLAAKPFPDTVGRFGLLQMFRYAIVPPALGSAGEEVDPATRAPKPGVPRLSLNVAFDGASALGAPVICCTLCVPSVAPDLS